MGLVPLGLKTSKCETRITQSPPSNMQTTIAVCDAAIRQCRSIQSVGWRSTLLSPLLAVRIHLLIDIPLDGSSRISVQFIQSILLLIFYSNSNGMYTCDIASVHPINIFLGIPHRCTQAVYMLTIKHQIRIISQQYVLYSNGMYTCDSICTPKKYISWYTASLHTGSLYVNH